MGPGSAALRPRALGDAVGDHAEEGALGDTVRFAPAVQANEETRVGLAWLLHGKGSGTGDPSLPSDHDVLTDRHARPPYHGVRRQVRQQGLGRPGGQEQLEARARTQAAVELVERGAHAGVHEAQIDGAHSPSAPIVREAEAVRVARVGSHRDARAVQHHVVRGRLAGRVGDARLQELGMEVRVELGVVTDLGEQVLAQGAVALPQLGRERGWEQVEEPREVLPEPR